MKNAKKLFKQLKEDYDDCLTLKELKDLSEFGKGMLYVLKILFKTKRISNN